MTLLLWMQDHESAYVVTDTLITSDRSTPVGFATKTTAVPHLGCVIAATGDMWLLQNYVASIGTRLAARNFDQLVSHSSNLLRTLVSEDPDAEAKRGDGLTTTVYSFGWSTDMSRVVAATFRSSADFELELRTEPGLGLKPNPIDVDIASNFGDALNNGDDLIGPFVRAGIQIQEEDRTREDSEHVGIGGHLILTALEMRDGRCSIMSTQLEAFPTAESDWMLICQQLQ